MIHPAYHRVATVAWEIRLQCLTAIVDRNQSLQQDVVDSLFVTVREWCLVSSHGFPISQKGFLNNMKFTIISDLVLTHIPVKMADHHLPSSSIVLPRTIATDAFFAEPQMFKTYGNITKAMKVIDDLPDGVLDSIPEVVSEAKRIIDQVDKDTVSNAVDMLKWFKYLRLI